MIRVILRISIVILHHDGEHDGWWGRTWRKNINHGGHGKTRIHTDKQSVTIRPDPCYPWFLSHSKNGTDA